MKNKIINYLISKIIKNKDFEPNPSKRIRSAWIVANKQYAELSTKEKQKIIEELNLD